MQSPDYNHPATVSVPRERLCWPKLVFLRLNSGVWSLTDFPAVARVPSESLHPHVWLFRSCWLSLVPHSRVSGSRQLIGGLVLSTKGLSDRETVIRAEHWQRCWGEVNCWSLIMDNPIVLTNTDLPETAHLASQKGLKHTNDAMRGWRSEKMSSSPYVCMRVCVCACISVWISCFEK